MSRMQHDLAISPFGAKATEMVQVARCAEQAGFDGVWTYDHMTGAMLDRGRSQDPFAVLGAMAVATERVRIGPLVANMMNRHPLQLAVAMATLQSLSSGRAVLGVGAGAAPGSRFAGEHDAIGTRLLTGPERRRKLVETIAVVRHLFAGRSRFEGEFFTINEPGPQLDQESAPPIIVGASGPQTIALAAEHADGVNIIANHDRLPTLLSMVTASAVDDSFETSIHELVDWDYPPAGDLPPDDDGIVGRRVLAVTAPFDLAAIAGLAARLSL